MRVSDSTSQALGTAAGQRLPLAPYAVCVLALLAWAPFYFGGNDFFAWAVNAILAGALVFVFEAHIWLRGAVHPVPLERLRAPAWLLACVLMWMLVQIVPGVPPFLQASAWKLASEALSQDLAGSISVNRLAGWLSIMRLLTAAAMFWVCVQLGRSERWGRLLMHGIAIISALYAGWGIASLTLRPGMVLWVAVPSAKGIVTSTFVSRNHYAIFAAVGAIVWLGLLTQAYRDRVSDLSAPWQYRVVRFFETIFGELTPYIAGLVLCVTSLVLTGSRGGLGAAAAGVLTFLLMRGAGARGGYRAVLPIMAALLLAGAVVFFMFGDIVGARLLQQGLGDSGRWAAYASELSAIIANPWLGYGAGAFADIFPIFRTADVGIWGFWDFAHNSYLDALIGLGVPGGLALIAIFVNLAALCCRRAGCRHGGAFPAIGVAVSVAVAVHAAIDFGLEIQGVTLTFMAILAVSVGRSLALRP